jgi:abortive infection bacteriophage resistance protein
MQRYAKPALSPQDLLGHVVSRGITITDGARALHALETIGYYRLLVYMRPLQRRDVDGTRRFEAGTTFEDVLALYDFDRKLRLLCMEAVERIEVALRTAIVSEVAVVHGAHFYLDAHHFVAPHACEGFQAAVRKEATRHPASRHYLRRYCDPPLPPVWVAMEAVTFGTLSHLFSNLSLALRRSIATRFAFDEVVLSSWFRSLTHLRNVAAHHARLWNASLTVDKPVVAKRLRAEFGPVSTTFFARAVAVTALLTSVDPASGWKLRLRRLMDENRHVDEHAMGFPEGWRSREFWK